MGSSLQELLFRKQLAEYVINVLNTVSDTDDRKESALKHYQAQLVGIERQIELAQEVVLVVEPDQPEKPKDIVIGLKTAQLFAHPRKVGDQNG